MNPADETARPPVLKNFPFPDLAEFKRALQQPGQVRLSADMGVALNWATNRRSAYVPRRISLAVFFWATFPYVVAAAYVAYVVATAQWLFLLALPLHVVAFQVYHPRTAMILGPIRLAAIAAAFAGFGAAVVVGSRGFAAICVVLVAEWLSLRSAYRESVNGFLHAVATHDDLFERCWNAGLVGIWLADGTKHWADCKYEAGRFVRDKGGDS